MISQVFIICKEDLRPLEDGLISARAFVPDRLGMDEEKTALPVD